MEGSDEDYELLDAWSESLLRTLLVQCPRIRMVKGGQPFPANVTTKKRFLFKAPAKGNFFVSMGNKSCGDDREEHFGERA